MQISIVTNRLLKHSISLLLGLVVFAASSLAGSPMKHRFVIPGGLMPNSVDPLDLDQFSNYFPGQMIYLQPLEAGLDGKLTSHVLSDFQHDETSNLITFKLGDWKYSDGSKVTIGDVALAIKRMALTRPSFPVLRSIEGIADWVKHAHPLTSSPKGLVVNGNTLTIQLSQKVFHPLFRFSLNVFSIIPSHCIDLQSSKVICKAPPTSGYYLAGTKNGTQIEYMLRGDLPKDIASRMPPSVVFEYAPKPLQELTQDPAYDSVGFAYDLDFTVPKYQELAQNFRIERLPSSWFSGFILNPKIKPFDRKECRRWFAKKFRSAFAAQDLGILQPSSSIFTSIIPGYMTEEQLGAGVPESAAVEDTCLKALRAHDFVFAIKTQSTPPFVQNALDKLARDLQIKLAPSVVGTSTHDRDKVAMRLANSGFWALDPVGDVQMLLSPNMHQDVADVASDPEVQALLKGIGSSMSPESISASMGKLNKYLHDDGLLNIFSNQGYFYISKKDRSKRPGATFSITVPYPWQVF